MDFNYNYTLPSQGIDADGNNVIQYDNQGGFMIFRDVDVAMNLNDAGQFLWGHAMKRLGFWYGSARFGSQANEGFEDSRADQNAIKLGYDYNVKTKWRSAGAFEGLPKEGFRRSLITGGRPRRR